jgi:hypothetical protein
MATPDAVRDAPPESDTPKQRQRGGTYSGRLLLRMPRSLHEELARASDREGISLNQFITGALAAAVDWRRADGASSSPPTARARSRRITFLLAVNLVLVALAAAAAIGFLIAAWLR